MIDKSNDMTDRDSHFHTITGQCAAFIMFNREYRIIMSISLAFVVRINIHLRVFYKRN